MRRIILTGSAPYFEKWWRENESLIPLWYEIHSLNTSFLLTKERCKRWIKSSDFYLLHKDLEPILKPWDDKLNPPAPPSTDPPVPKHPTVSIQWPFVYWRNETSGTMLFNALLEYVTDDFWWRQISEVNIIGCDLVYKEGQQNHFYGNGTPDPLRLGLDCIKCNLNMFKKLYERMGIGLYNLSPSEDTLLPFERKTLSSLV